MIIEKEAEIFMIYDRVIAPGQNLIEYERNGVTYKKLICDIDSIPERNMESTA